MNTDLHCPDIALHVEFMDPLESQLHVSHP